MSAKPQLINISLVSQDGEVVLRMAEEYISSSSILLHLSPGSEWEAMVMLAEENVYQLILYPVTSLSSIRMRGCTEDGWGIYQLILYPVLFQSIIRIRAVLRMAEDISSSSIRLHLSLLPGWEAVLRMAEECNSSSSIYPVTSPSIIRIKGCAEDGWGVYQLILYPITSLSIIRLRGCVKDGWGYISSSSILCYLSLSS